jgi:translocation and assembly module TamA
MYGLVRRQFALGIATAAWLAAAPALADEPSATIAGVENKALRDAILRALTQSKDAPQSRAEARRRARDAGEDVVAVLRAEGYYAYAVEPDISEGDPPRGVVKVTPGPVFVLQDPKIAWQGRTPDEGVAQRAVTAMHLTPGEPGRAADVLGAEGRVIAQIQQLGYADVAADPREVIVDHADHTVRPTFNINAGDLTKLDGVEVITKGRSNPAWVYHLAPWKSGDVYDPEDVAELERRLRDTSVYDSISVSLSPKDKITADGLRPVIVNLTDRPSRTIELGAGYSTSEGPGVDARWIRYNRLRRADTTTYTARLAKLEKRFETELALPHWRRPQETLKLNGAVFAETTDAYDETGATISANLTKRRQTTSYRTYGVALDVSQSEQLEAGSTSTVKQTLNLATVTTLGAFAWDKSDNILDPKRGWRLEARGEPTAILGDTTLAYLRTQVQGSAYLPFGENASTVLAGRVKVGAIFGALVSEVPASRRFFSGGGGSVRGYAYQAIGPRLSDNTPQGGVSLVETSLEVRHRFTSKWGGVAFIDAGAIGTERKPKQEDFRLGAGFGVRYDLGFGPIRADIAVPLGKRSGDPAFQIYLSIGQSF